MSKDSKYQVWVEMEMEHAKSLRDMFRATPEQIREFAKKVVEDHLREDPNYYKKMEEADIG